jgi:putative pyruvate formate lyase activating enzyme
MGTANHQEALAKLKGMLSSCTLCPRRCRVDRTRGEQGFCRLGDQIVMDCALVHHGEEPPLSGRCGAGTIFFSSCNLKCIYCQNYQISHDIKGESPDSAALARIMLSLQDKGCHNIEPVTPTSQTPQIMAALLIAREQGLQLPFVYNCGGYEEPEVIKMLAGMVDIYLPDFKYGHDDDGLMFSGVKDYPALALASIKEMVRQVGDELETDHDIARRGLLIRHLILPGRTENSFAALRLIKKNISLRVALSIMSQYTPIPALARHPILGRRITRREYEAVVNFALDLGFENIFAQEVSDHHLSPDFNQDDPFHSNSASVPPCFSDGPK